MTNYKLSGGEKGESLVVVYSDGEPASIPGTHPNFDTILALLRSGTSDDEAVKTLVNTLHVAGTKLAALTDRVSVASFGVFFDGDPLRSELADVLTQLLEENREEDLTAVAKFLENAAANQTFEGIDAMYRWITNKDLVLTKDGTFLAYKGVRFVGDNKIESITRGTAMVDGVVHEGAIPNPIGSVISMPRSEVTSETSIGCGPGLHAGTYNYAKNFGGGNLILVEINPRDVVSVPSDSSFQKLRVSKYKVVKKIEDRIEYPVYTYDEEDSDLEDDYEDYEDFEDDYEDDGDFTEEGEVDEQPTIKSIFEEAFAAKAEDSKKEEEDAAPDTNLNIEGHEPKATKLRKFAKWLAG